MNTRIAVLGVTLIGLALIALALGVILVPPGTLHAPRWALGAIGAAFVLGGLLAATRSGGRLTTGLAAALLTALGGLGGWLAVSAHEAPASRGVYGLAAALTLIWAAYAWRLVLRLR